MAPGEGAVNMGVGSGGQGHRGSPIDIHTCYKYSR